MGETTPPLPDEKKLKRVHEGQNVPPIDEFLKAGKSDWKGGKSKNIYPFPLSPSPRLGMSQALGESRQADAKNKDHLDMRINAVKALGEGEDKSELEKILKPGEWTTRAHWTLMRKVLHIGFNVYALDGIGLKFKFSDPADEPNENHVMVNLLYDGSHYDLILFGELSDEKLMGFVFFYLLI
jgi:hypothetical protein